MFASGGPKFPSRRPRPSGGQRLTPRPRSLIGVLNVLDGTAKEDPRFPQDDLTFPQEDLG